MPQRMIPDLSVPYVYESGPTYPERFGSIEITSRTIPPVNYAMRQRVLAHLLFASDPDSSQMHVNLSRKDLITQFPGSKPPDRIVHCALASFKTLEQAWCERKKQRGHIETPKRSFFNFADHLFDLLGNLPLFADILTTIQKQDQSRDPIKIS